MFHNALEIAFVKQILDEIPLTEFSARFLSLMMERRMMYSALIGTVEK